MRQRSNDICNILKQKERLFPWKEIIHVVDGPPLIYLNNEGGMKYGYVDLNYFSNTHYQEVINH